MSLDIVPHKPKPVAVTPVDIPEISLSKQEKAAILLRVLLSSGAAPALNDVDTASLRKIMETMGNFGKVDRKTIDLVILEFLTELQEFGIALKGDIEDTIAALKGHVSDKTLESIKKSYMNSPTVDVWKAIISAETDDLRNVLLAEDTIVAATVLSKIPSTKAADVLGGMEPFQARETMLAIVNSGDTTPEIVEIIGHGICASLFQDDGPSAFEKPAVERAGDIMNFAQSEIRDRLLDEFTESDPETADRIRKVMFTFADIPIRLQPRDVSAVTRVVEQEVLIRALKGAETEHADIVEFILSNLATRAADALREELSETTVAKKKLVEAAMNEIIAGIRQLEGEGEITLIVEGDDDED